MVFFEKKSTKVFVGSLETGGEEIVDMLVILDRANFNVLGIGVADIYNIFTLGLMFFTRSFCRTPNLCSSSTIIRELDLLNSNSVVTGDFDRNGWVDFVEARVHQRNLTARLLYRWRNKQKRVGFFTWKSATLVLRQEESVQRAQDQRMRGVIARIQGRRLSQAWQAWRSMVVWL